MLQQMTYLLQINCLSSIIEIVNYVNNDFHQNGVGAFGQVTDPEEWNV
jgi:hypothetical protein